MKQNNQLGSEFSKRFSRRSRKAPISFVPVQLKILIEISLMNVRNTRFLSLRNYLSDFDRMSLTAGVIGNVHPITDHEVP